MVRYPYSEILKGKEKMSRSEIEKAAEMEKSKAVRTLNSLIEKKILKKQVQAGESDTP